VIADRIDCQTLTTWRALSGARSGKKILRAVTDLAATARYERRILRSAAATVVVGEDDARALRRLARGAVVRTIPNGVRVRPAARREDEAPLPTVLFTGVLDFEPNVTAVHHFAEKVWPAVRRRRPDGSIRRLDGQSGIGVLPDVPDMAEVIARSWVCVAPMTSGSGIKNKVLEAWMLGRPVVMFPIAANGLRLDGRAESCIVPGAGEMAGRVVHLLKSREERWSIGEACRDLAVREHGWERAAADLSSLLGAVVEGGRAGAGAEPRMAER
jgi:glycosyltransferase involved in cell wall biosynthesis